MHAIRRHIGDETRLAHASSESSALSTSLVEVLWSRRWILGSTGLACVLIAAIYLFAATKIYTASAKILVEQNVASPLIVTHGDSPANESFVPTQADLFQSGPVLARALEAVHFHDLKTFANAGPDPIAWLQRGNGFRVDVAKKSDVILVTMESPYPREASDFVNAVVASYKVEQTERMRGAGAELIKSLQAERDRIGQQRDTALAAMQKFRQDNNLLSLGSDKANTTIDRVATLSNSLTTAEMASFTLRADLASTKAALADPASLSAFVEAQQFKGKDTGDREYDDLRNQLIQQMLALSTSSALQGPNHSRVKAMEIVVGRLKAEVAEKERQIASAHLISLQTQLAAAEQNELQLRAALKAQKDQTIGMGPAAAEYVRLESDVARIQKQSEEIDSRIGEVTVNDVNSTSMTAQVLEWAHPAVRPIKPNKTMIMAAALMIGGLLGIGLALMREWKDSRLRSPAEILTALNTPVIAVVPPLNPTLSAVARGQILYLDSHSSGAEAYRSIRTSLQLGACRDSRTLLVTSPTSGEGKSTTASNLAIAFAQAGHRTLLLDCDMREPVLHLIFEADCSVGLTSVIAGEEKLRDAICQTRVPGLYLLPCGPLPSDPSELLSGRRFSRLMKSLLSTFDRIVIDSPPLMSVGDSHILAASADATLLVLRMKHSSRQLGALAIDGLEKVGANVLGAIANDVISSTNNRYYGGSWQYQSTARRVLAPAAGQSPQSESLQHSQAGAHHGQSALSIDEPEWSADGGAAKNVATLLASVNVGQTASSHARDGVEQNATALGNGHENDGDEENKHQW